MGSTLKESDELVNGEESDGSFYSNAANYWSKVPPTVDGMLGGFGVISHTDISGSEKFLKLIYKWPNPPGNRTAVDCGAGIGRITKCLLQNHFENIDLVEQNPNFLEEAKKSLSNCKKIGSYFPIGLQNFIPEAGKYDVIWCQWVLGHLTDEDFMKFFQRCREGLSNDGVIVVKENISADEVVRDDLDSSVTRPLKALKSLLHQAGLKILLNHRQRKFPSGLLEVRMLALRPAPVSIADGGDLNSQENSMEAG
ncbi:hypothetical protein J437_LFUL003870 [Ladona fulva]|uniref:Alpha N-terminal protein methyltransferase 1 n=1 Tax=Ladona fulva TaxID=123851 RepID=A0A8K0K5Q5_LADFU|nr:hypothetical protein J437_LFUL003870 [Ladona fulva]